MTEFVYKILSAERLINFEFVSILFIILNFKNVYSSAIETQGRGYSACQKRSHVTQGAGYFFFQNFVNTHYNFLIFHKMLEVEIAMLCVMFGHHVII